MKIIISRVAVSAVVGATLLIPSPTFAEMAVQQNLEAIFQFKDVNSSEAKFEEYRDVPNGLVIEKYELSASSATTEIEVEINNLSQEDQSAKVELDKGRFNIEASWDQTPHRYSNEAVTPFVESSDGVLSAPDQSQKDIQFGTATYSAAYSGALRPVELETRTDVAALKLDYILKDRLVANFGVSETIKKGHKAMGASFTRGHVVQIAQPIDQKTYDSNVGLGYAGQKYQWNMGYGFSAFENDRENITLDNPRRFTDLTTESSQGRLNAASDNVAHFGSLAGGINISKKTRATADINVTYMRQNEPLLPYTINTASNPTNGTNWTGRPRPSETADATVVNWDQNYRVSSQLTKTLKGGIHYHHFQQNNKTPEYTFDGSVGLDFNFSGTDTQNHAFEMKKETMGANLDYQMLESLNVGASYDVKTTKRQHREVEDQEENIANLDLDYQPIRGILLRGTYTNAIRRMDAFHAQELIDIGELPGMRLSDVSDRDRNEGKILFQLSTAKTTLGLNGSLGHDKYKPGKGDLASISLGGDSTNLPTMYGLLESRNAGAGVDFDTTLSDRFSVFGFYDYQTDTNHQRSNYNSSSAASQDAATDWEHEVKNLYKTAGLGLKADVGDVALTLGADIAMSKADYNFVAKGSNATLQALVNLPETRTTTQNYYVQAMVPVSPKLDFGLGYVFEKYDVYDWAADQSPNVNLYGTTAELYLGDSSRDYKAHIVTARAKYKF